MKRSGHELGIGEIWYGMAPEHQQRGITTEAARAFFTHAFTDLGMHRLFGDCDPRNITCQTLVAVTCPDGQVPSVLNHCYGACVSKDKCAPVACLTYIEASDGTCSRPANDPCRGQDPDCVSDPKK
jgi:hypothetical protein